MGINNPPNTADFPKKSPARKKRCNSMRRNNEKTIDLSSMSEHDRMAVSYLFASALLVCAATVLKEMFVKPTAE